MPILSADSISNPVEIEKLQTRLHYAYRLDLRANKVGYTEHLDCVVSAILDVDITDPTLRAFTRGLYLAYKSAILSK